MVCVCLCYSVFFQRSCISIFQLLSVGLFLLMWKFAHIVSILNFSEELCESQGVTQWISLHGVDQYGYKFPIRYDASILLIAFFMTFMTEIHDRQFPSCLVIKKFLDSLWIERLSKVSLKRICYLLTNDRISSILLSDLN